MSREDERYSGHIKPEEEKIIQETRQEEEALLDMRSEREAEERYRAVMEEEKPDLWESINRKLDAAAAEEDMKNTEKDPHTEEGVNKMKEITNKKQGSAREKEGRKKVPGFWKRTFAGSTLRAAAAVFAICILGIGALGTLDNISYMSSSYERFSFDEAASGRTASQSGSTSSVSAAKSAARTEEAAAEEAADYDTPVEDGAYYDLTEEAPLAAAEGEEAVSNDAGSSLGIAGSGDEAYLKTQEAAAASGQAETAQPDESGKEAEDKGNKSRKLIRNISMSAETKEFDKLLEDLKVQVEQTGGYIESSGTSGRSYGDYGTSRSAWFTLRIPSAKTDVFLEKVRGESNVTNTSESTEDVTLRYVDMQSHVNTLREEQKQLLKLMEKAESMEDLLAIRSQLTDIRYELESYESQLKTYDNLVDYDTISLNISEVKDITPVAPRSVWQKMGDGFMRGLKGAAEAVINFLIMLVSSIPYLVILFAVIFGIISLVKALLGRRRNKKAGPAGETGDEK